MCESTLLQLSTVDFNIGHCFDGKNTEVGVAHGSKSVVALNK